ncbi:MAG: hypothetical protein BGO26_01265 [Actinobacteria bacterium 69-20]|nr:hypothetical protein [Actinomycetota bacterium]OJV23773.1 MAG: hypothetical protein BGO26_01265 [Actinobacteria bacterium 69-20]
MTTLQHRPSLPHRPSVRVTGRTRAAAIVVILVALGIVAGTFAALHALRGYQVTLNVVGAGAMVGAAVLLLRGDHGGGRKLSVILTWLAAFGVVAEAGDRQARVNDVGAISATNTNYFLPGLLWLGMAALLCAAVAVTALTKRPKGTA